MDVHWQRKKERSKQMSSQSINECYDFAMRNGALGGKVIGAGGGASSFSTPRRSSGSETR